MVKIRFATLQDLERLRDCEAKVWESLREALPDSFVAPNIQFIQTPEFLQHRRQILESREGVILIAEEDGEVIGLALGRVNADGVSILGFLGVKKQHQRKGIGSNLLESFLLEAKNRNAHKVWLFTAPSLHWAIRLYVRAGFVPEGYMRRHSYGLDLIVYSKFLN